MRFGPLALLAPLYLLSACGQAPQFEQSNRYQLESTAFGQSLHIETWSTQADIAQQAMQVAVDDLHYIAEISHPWRPGALERTNVLLAMQGEFSANPSGLPLIDQATALYRQSDGHFNPAMGQLQRLWGFHQDAIDLAQPADAEAIDAVLNARPDMDAIRVQGIRIAASNAQLRLDYGHFARGHGLNIARQRLQEAGLSQARLQTPNAWVLLGKPEAAVALSHYGGLPLLLETDESVYTLSVDDRYYRADGQQIHPFISPFDGQPVQGIRHLSVIHPSAASAAGLAQALLIAGLDALPALANQMGVADYLLEDQSGQRYASAAMLARLPAESGILRLTEAGE
ncbi:MAG: FAD:protein FMN transferase [Thiohalomonadaceae bacterium]